MRRLSLCLRRQWLTLILAMVLDGLILNGFWGSSGPRDLLILRRQANALVRKRDTLAADNAAFRKRIESLKSDDAYLQRLIRQELGYVRSGELVYRFAKPERP
jgi:cell division protein FtsB